MDDPLRVIIVEDEYRIAVLINKLIHWDELHLKFAGLFGNGCEALDAIAQSVPNIVISDIKMPVMDGIELARNIREQGFDIRVVLISGFREFEYAQNALRYGVNDYLVKPINETELNATLGKIYEEYCLRVKQQSETQQLEDEIRRSQPVLYREALQMLETGTFEEGIGVFNRNYTLCLRDGIMRVLLIKFDPFVYQAVNEYQDQIILEKIAGYMRASCGGIVFEKIVSVRAGTLTVMGLYNYPLEQKNVFEHAVRDLLADVKKYTGSFDRGEITIGMGSEESFETVFRSFQSADACVKARIVIGTGKVIQDSDCPVQAHGISAMEYISHYRVRIENAIQSFSEPQCKQILDEIFKTLIKTDMVQPGLIYECAEELIRIFFVLAGEHEDSGRKLRCQIQHCCTVSGLTDTLKEQFGISLQRIKELREEQSSRPIREAKEFIDHHFSEKITLEDVAEVLQLNSTYFSVLFKKETGQNFSVYITGLRMAKAKEMLRTTNYTMDRIAEQVGYEDTRYFSQNFIKVVGMKPSLFRKLYS
ncbi:DNA-binding response regulator [Spirochaetia bacterium]|nr:DNA-binding response regulator [Spirochaetia bacterium]